ncbi:hypothetical protein IW261DRAFT_1426485 [Armillaria novae-zelandiae]|uniref:Uncharacterized protein n=1 Tax=Armillaria novae-zelandiae TaxID=153914 RepID=A0AA39NKY7_9AGAR|nr:hypothetical protein IW261DRAFT_1426485 [Armillaria novae-zelandiae]
MFVCVVLGVGVISVFDAVAFLALCTQTPLRHAALLQLSGVDDLPDFPILRKEDMFSKNAAGAWVLGDGAMTDSWIWTYRWLRGMNKGEKQEFLMDALRVQWFRTHADTEWWMEEVEILEQEF